MTGDAVPWLGRSIVVLASTSPVKMSAVLQWLSRHKLLTSGCTETVGERVHAMYAGARADDCFKAVDPSNPTRGEQIGRLLDKFLLGAVTKN